MARDLLRHHPSEGTARHRRASSAMLRADARENPPVLPFFALTFVWTWALWWTAAATSQLFACVAFTSGAVIGLVATWIALGVVALTVARRVLRSLDTQ